MERRALTAAEQIDYHFSCEGKTCYTAMLPATKAAYHLSEARGKEFGPYRCRWCESIHLGRINRKRRPES